MSSEITNRRLQLHIPGASELTRVTLGQNDGGYADDSLTCILLNEKI